MRRFIRHTEKTRVMTDAEYLDYYKKNEVHMLANKFELPEYYWAEGKLDREYRVACTENQEVLGPAREKWIAKYRQKVKGFNYAPAIDYWCMSFDQWVPNYNRHIIDNVDRMGALWNDWVSSPARYACWRSEEYSEQ
eukprot:gene19095-23209_t